MNSGIIQLTKLLVECYPADAQSETHEVGVTVAGHKTSKQRVNRSQIALEKTAGSLRLAWFGNVGL